MTIKLLRCAICDDWHSPKHHCFNCGAHAVAWSWNGKRTTTKYFNHDGIEMARAIPRPIHQIIRMEYE